MSAMAFKLKKINHTPNWYREHCTEEDGGSPAFRAMLKIDMAYIGADNDSRLCYQEKVERYDERWNAIMQGAENLHEPGGGIFRSSVLKNDMMKLVEREAMDGFRTSDQFKGEPFASIDKLMTDSGLNETVMREFLKWRSQKSAVAKRTEVEVQDMEPASEPQARDELRQRMKRGHQFFE